MSCSALRLVSTSKFGPGWTNLHSIRFGSNQISFCRKSQTKVQEKRGAEFFVSEAPRGHSPDGPQVQISTNFLPGKFLAVIPAGASTQNKSFFTSCFSPSLETNPFQVRSQLFCSVFCVRMKVLQSLKCLFVFQSRWRRSLKLRQKLWSRRRGSRLPRPQPPLLQVNPLQRREPGSSDSRPPHLRDFWSPRPQHLQQFLIQTELWVLSAVTVEKESLTPSESPSCFWWTVKRPPHEAGSLLNAPTN